MAALTLGATAWQMGLLSAAGTAPTLLVGLLAGVWVDRLPRRPVLISTSRMWPSSRRWSSGSGWSKATASWMIGLPLTLVTAEGGMLLASLWLLLSPVRHLRVMPATEAVD